MLRSGRLCPTRIYRKVALAMDERQYGKIIALMGLVNETLDEIVTLLNEEHELPTEEQDTVLTTIGGGIRAGVSGLFAELEFKTGVTFNS